VPFSWPPQVCSTVQGDYALALRPSFEEVPKRESCRGTPRFVVDGNRITGGGISSGLDEALKLVEILTSRAVAEDVQLTMQYYPDPPVSSPIPPAGDCFFSW
jgi:cyclohexyl-isocyanide hydratase